MKRTNAPNRRWLVLTIALVVVGALCYRHLVVSEPAHVEGGNCASRSRGVGCFAKQTGSQEIISWNVQRSSLHDLCADQRILRKWYVDMERRVSKANCLLYRNARSRPESSKPQQLLPHGSLERVHHKSRIRDLKACCVQQA